MATQAVRSIQRPDEAEIVAAVAELGEAFDVEQAMQRRLLDAIHRAENEGERQRHTLNA